MYIQLGINKVEETGEFRVNYKENGRSNEDKSYYTDDEEDAIRTFVVEYNKARKRYGKTNVGKAWGKLTTRLLDKYKLTIFLDGMILSQW